MYSAIFKISDHRRKENGQSKNSPDATSPKSERERQAARRDKLKTKIGPAVTLHMSDQDKKRLDSVTDWLTATVLAKQTAMLKKSQLSGLAPKNIEQIRFSVNTVRTMQHQKSPEIYECAANLLMTGPEQSTKHPITYTVQQTEERKQSLVNVVG